MALLAGAAVLALFVLSPSAAARPEASVVVKVAFNASLKKSILVDGRGRTLYLYTADTSGTPACYNDPTYHCSKAWLPLLTTGAPKAGAGAKASLLGTVKRTDGHLQVMYKNHPLYTAGGKNSFGLVPDTKPGDIHGQGFAGIWYVLSPTGAMITKMPS